MPKIYTDKDLDQMKEFESAIEEENLEITKKAVNKYNKKVRLYKKIMDEVKPHFEWLVENRDNKNFFLIDCTLGKASLKEWRKRIAPIKKKYKAVLERDRTLYSLDRPIYNYHCISINFSTYVPHRTKTIASYKEKRTRESYDMLNIHIGISSYILNLEPKPTAITIPKAISYSQLSNSAIKVRKLFIKGIKCIEEANSVIDRNSELFLKVFGLSRKYAR